ncbi:hypothetical protein GLAREA_03143 [Glarea lozoyensis ATCC 20868]|uniref:Modin n=1 Tax=Glarea lozoyensis (strain ATCC 20868 / MF5171) TaxID=1116229 RepID=S3DKZ2_GLAL2|nr:uncharacterized protein GLAREA_03143 [Glarea lozoyensis ATCC 20868]EPE27228.1 hypothetical protein GLAREA_03143 [Glarea lozoyensis ATCC 20868]
MSNSTGSGQADNSDNVVTLQLTIAALAISIAAIFLSTLQALLAYLQFDNSEVGRRRCSEEVMGKLWATRTTRKFKWREFRYQVFFEVPVFYTANPGITVGPLTRTKPESTFWDTLFQNNQKETYSENVKTLEPEAEAMEVIELQKHIHPIYKITGTKTSCAHTMTKYHEVDEKWANVHTAEDEGCSWVLLLDALQGQEKSSRDWDNSKEPGKNHTISYLIQRKQRCWDFMPLNITKPFATTTICHLVEIISMLGLVWTEFNLQQSVLTAEGNGYMVKSEYMQGLGILTRFSRLGKPQHKEERMIPCAEIKRLCFGDVPSIFDQPKQKLLFGPGRFENTLRKIMPRLDEECQRDFLDNTEKPYVIASSFELLGMVAKSVHILGSRFRRLPNPCAATWNPNLNMIDCLLALSQQLKSPDGASLGDHKLRNEIQDLFTNGSLGKIDLDKRIQTYIRANKEKNDPGARSGWAYTAEAERTAHEQLMEENYDTAHRDLLDSLHDNILSIDRKLEDMIDDVREVLACHFNATSKLHRELEDLLAGATLDNTKEKILINFYFAEVLPKVTAGLPTSAASTPQRSATLKPPSITVTSSQSSTLGSNASDTRSAVWLALMFKMCSWLFLHDFNPYDRMIERSEFSDNRLPVYIG